MRKKIPLLVCVSLFLTGIAGCPPSHEEVCKNKIPEFRAGLENVPDAGTAEDSSLTVAEKEQWAKWTRNWLEKFQLVLDTIGDNQDYSIARRHFSDMCNMLVIFHGRVEHNTPEKMRALADEMIYELDLAEQEYCFGGLNPALLAVMSSPLDAASPSPSPSPSPSKKKKKP